MRSLVGYAKPLLPIRDQGVALHVSDIVSTTLFGAIVWWLRRFELGYRALQIADAVLILLVTLLLDLNTALYPVRSVSIFHIALATGLGAVLRAVIVPSTAARTLVLGIAGSAIALTVFLLSALHPAS